MSVRCEFSRDIGRENVNSRRNEKKSQACDLDHTCYTGACAWTPERDERGTSGSLRAGRRSDNRSTTVRRSRSGRSSTRSMPWTIRSRRRRARSTSPVRDSWWARGVVLLKHKRLGFWLQPGGHIDPGETPWDAAKRGVLGGDRPRRGVRRPVRRVGGPRTGACRRACRGTGAHPSRSALPVRCRSADGGAADPHPPEGESQEIAWFDWEVAIDVADPGLRGALAPSAPEPDGPRSRCARHRNGSRVAIRRTCVRYWVRGVQQPILDLERTRSGTVGSPRDRATGAPPAARRGTPVATARRGAASDSRSRRRTIVVPRGSGGAVRGAALPFELLVPRRRLASRGVADRGCSAGLEALAITDHNGFYGVVRFAEAAKASACPPCSAPRSRCRGGLGGRWAEATTRRPDRHRARPRLARPRPTGAPAGDRRRARLDMPGRRGARALAMRGRGGRRSSLSTIWRRRSPVTPGCSPVAARVRYRRR